MIRDVVRVALLEKPKQFLIEYVGEPKSYIYEAKSVADARMLFIRLPFLLAPALSLPHCSPTTSLSLMYCYEIR